MQKGQKLNQNKTKKVENFLCKIFEKISPLTDFSLKKKYLEKLIGYNKMHKGLLKLQNVVDPSYSTKELKSRNFKKWKNSIFKIKNLKKTEKVDL